MLATLTVLLCAFGDDQGFETKRPVPVIPIPIGNPVPWDYALRTDWTPVTARKSVWRTATRTDDESWEEAVIGQRGGRTWTRASHSNDDYVFATTGRSRAGSGGVGAGFVWSVYVGSEWDVGVDVEFTPTGPRVVIAARYYPFGGHQHRYGWSVLSNQLVHGIGWHFEERDLAWISHAPRYISAVLWHELEQSWSAHRE